MDRIGGTWKLALVYAIRDKMSQLSIEHTDRLEELQWHIPSLVAEKQYERQITEGFNLKRLTTMFSDISTPDNFNSYSI